MLLLLIETNKGNKMKKLSENQIIVLDLMPISLQDLGLINTRYIKSYWSLKHRGLVEDMRALSGENVICRKVERTVENIIHESNYLYSKFGAFKLAKEDDRANGVLEIRKILEEERNQHVG